jgi:hypothetical protein
MKRMPYTWHTITAQQFVDDNYKDRPLDVYIESQALYENGTGEWEPRLYQVLKIEPYMTPEGSERYMCTFFDLHEDTSKEMDVEPQFELRVFDGKFTE